MKKIVLVAVLLFMGALGFSQEKKVVNVVKEGSLYKVTYYHDNGEIAQEGFFNEENKLDGIWKSYNSNGKKVSMGSYDNGQKIGKWFFWHEDKLTEVDFKNYRVAAVSEWKSTSSLVVKD